MHVTPEFASCTCKDFELTNGKCKHIFAVEIIAKREEHSDGTITETIQITQTAKRTYRQNWAAYNESQTKEKEKFRTLLRDLCSGIQEPEETKPKRGRPRVRLSDAVFALVFKVYSTISARRFATDLREAKDEGLISRSVHFNTIYKYLEAPGMTELLKGLKTKTSLPLAVVENDFAVDSSGFTTQRFTSWYDHKYGVTRYQHDWVKVHVMTGVKTNVVTAIEIRDRNTCDITQFRPLVNATAKNFRINEVSADKLYATVDNLNAVGAVGGTPYVAFMKRHNGKAGGLWGQMFHYFQFRRDDFLGHYHKRSNIESTFSMIKRKFGDFLRSKTDRAMVNETLCKIICHNIVCLIHEMHELGIEPIFWDHERTPEVEGAAG